MEIDTKGMMGVMVVVVGISMMSQLLPTTPTPPPDPPPAPLPGLANLYGRVTNTATGEAIPGVTVILNSVETLTDALGDYAFTDIEPGEYAISFSKEGYEALETTGITVAEGNNVLNAQMALIPAAEATFALASGFKRNYLNAADYMTIEVQNIGEVAGICTLTLSTLRKVYSACPSVPAWNNLGSVSHSLEPGETITFGEGEEWVIIFPVSDTTWQGCEVRGLYLKIEGNAGIYEEYYAHFA